MAGMDKDDLPYVAYQGPELAGLMQSPKCSEHNDLTIQVIEEFGADWGRVAFIAYLLGWEDDRDYFSPFGYKGDSSEQSSRRGRRMLIAVVNNLRNNKEVFVLDRILDDVDEWDADQIAEYYRYMRKKQLERESIW